MTIETPWIMQKADPGDPDIEYPARLIRRALVSMEWDEGVDDLLSWKVTQRAAGATFSVDISAGRGWVEGDDEVLQGTYWSESTATENVPVSAAPGANSRYDLVVAQIEDQQAGGGGTTPGMVFDVVAGTASATPTPPALPDSAQLLAVIGPIATATASITDAIIWDSSNWSSAPAAVQALAATAHRPAGRRLSVGVALDYFGTILPTGYLWENGADVSRTTYARLWHAMGKPNTGNGSTTFTLPDGRDRAHVGMGNMGGATDAALITATLSLAEEFGAATHTLSTAEMPSHNHTITQTAHVHGLDPIQFVDGDVPTPPVEGIKNDTSEYNAGGYSAVTAGANANISLAAAGGGGAHNNVQPSVYVNRIIRV